MLEKRFRNRDCIEFMPKMPDKSVTMLLTDIPYGKVNRASNGLRNLDKSLADVQSFNLPLFLSSILRVTSGSIYIFCGTEQVSTIRHELVKGGMSTRLGIWEKTNPSPMNGQHIWLSSIECCVYGKFPNATFNEHCKGSVWRFASQQSKIHPTQKPLKLFKYLIETSSIEGDIIFDPCAGSGTTALAAIETNRKFFCLESNKEYYDLAIARLQEPYAKT